MSGKVQTWHDELSKCSSKCEQFMGCRGQLFIKNCNKPIGDKPFNLDTSGKSNILKNTSFLSWSNDVPGEMEETNLETLTPQVHHKHVLRHCCKSKTGMTCKSFFLDVIFPYHISTYKTINSAELGLVGIGLWFAICTDKHDPVHLSGNSKSAM